MARGAPASLLLAAAMLWALLQPSKAVAETPVDVELVLAVDVSGSMDMDEQELQRAGYLEAIVHPEVLEAIRLGVYGRIAVTYMEWAGAQPPSVVVPWAVIEDLPTARSFADALSEAPIVRIRGTSISLALGVATTLFDDNDYQGIRRVIDVSGDGPNNMGAPVEPMRDAALEQGIIINGLPIMVKQDRGGFSSIPNLDVYFAECVIGGPGSFVLPVTEREQLAEAIRQKLMLDIAGLPPRAIRAMQPAQAAPLIDCMVGERLRRGWDPY
jgi:Protein of unknown function (DUF1194)